MTIQRECEAKMPVSYRIDQDNGMIRTRCVGNVTFEEVVDHFRDLEQDPNCPDRLDVLLDLTQTTSVPSTEQLRAVSRVIGGIQATVRFDSCAIAASTDVLFGMSRVFEVVARERFGATYVFRTVAEAEAWLLSRRQRAVKYGNSSENSP
ncbi:MAG: hypothetical protein WB579_21700 [Bryobacteraceae bacterium]